MSTRPLPLPKNEEKYREEILDRIEEGWQGEKWVVNMPQIANAILHQNLLTTRTPPATRTSYEADGIQWILLSFPADTFKFSRAKMQID